MKQPDPFRILLVEDDPMNQRLIGHVLRSLGANVEVASDGRQALAALARQAPRLVLMDCQMPVMDGFQATVEFRRIEKAQGSVPVPIVAITAVSSTSHDERLRECLEAGMDGLVLKPVDIDHLTLCVEQWSAPLAVDPIPLTKLARLNRPGMPDVPGELTAIFLRNAPDYVKAIASAHAADDQPTLRRAAHTLKSNAAAMGAHRLSLLCLSLEERGRLEVRTYTAETLARLEAELERVVRELQSTSSHTQAA